MEMELNLVLTFYWHLIETTPIQKNGSTFTNVSKSHAKCQNFETLIQWNYRGLQDKCLNKKKWDLNEKWKITTIENIGFLVWVHF